LNQGPGIHNGNLLKTQYKKMAQFVARLLHGYITRYEPLRSPLPPLNQSSYTNFSFHDWPSLPHPASYFFWGFDVRLFPVSLESESVQVVWSNRELRHPPAALNLPPVISGGHRRIPRASSLLPLALSSGHPQYDLSPKTSRGSTGVPVGLAAPDGNHEDKRIICIVK
jgi:hypothetical protein